MKLTQKASQRSTKTLAIVGSTLAALTLSAAVMAHSGFDGDHHRKGYGHHKGGHHQFDERHMEKRLGKMQRYLELTDTQTEELKALFEEQQEQRAGQPPKRSLRSAMMQLRPDAEGYDAQVQQLIEQHQAQVAEHIQSRAAFQKAFYNILEPAQWEKLQEMKERRHSKWNKQDNKPDAS